eukprot:5349417-Pyramimonas_sp.AAC.1
MGRDGNAGFDDGARAIQRGRLDGAAGNVDPRAQRAPLVDLAMRPTTCRMGQSVAGDVWSLRRRTSTARSAGQLWWP